MPTKSKTASSNKYTLLTLLFLAIFISSCSMQTKRSNNIDPLSSNSYDEQYAQKLGADDYGMKKYVMAFLKSGPNRSKDEESRNMLQRAHLDNITRMAEAGSLVLAGPFLDDGEIRGIYIFNVESIEEAEALTKTDPAIQAGSLIMELHPWYGSAAILEISKLHNKVAKKGI
jgi:uncharacterized protein YciI